MEAGIRMALEMNNVWVQLGGGRKKGGGNLSHMGRSMARPAGLQRVAQEVPILEMPITQA
jgi:hypothetical protein